MAFRMFPKDLGSLRKVIDEKYAIVIKSSQNNENNKVRNLKRVETDNLPERSDRNEGPWGSDHPASDKAGARKRCALSKLDGDWLVRLLMKSSVT